MPTACSAPTPSASRLFDVDIGTQYRHRRHDRSVDARVHCAEVCAGVRGCAHCKLLDGGGVRGTLATCSLYSGDDGASLARFAATPRADTVVLLRSDANKLAWLTRCHSAHVQFVRAQLESVATLELLVDVTALGATNRTDAARRAQAQLQAALGVGSFVYTVEDLWAAFPAVRRWPSPEQHDSSRNRLKGGDVVKIWWAKVLKRQRRSLGPSVARRLTSYLIHEPSLVLWARARRAAGRSVPAFTWVLEDDDVFLGDLGASLGLFGTADLVATFANLVGQQIEASSHDWKANGAFTALYANRRVHKWEHVERFSARLIERLDTLLTEHGAAAHGEMFASTVCLAEPWCVAHDLRLAGLVDPDARLFGPSTSVLEASERWERRQLFDRHRAKSAPGVWVHAVKDYCNALALASNESVRVSIDDPDVPFVHGRLGMPGAPATPARIPEAAAQACSAAGALDAVALSDGGGGHWCADSSVT